MIILPGDYELFSLYSQRMFALLRRFSPIVEEYSVDEGFADLSGMRRPLHSSYGGIARKVQEAMRRELDLSVSVGVSLTKSLAKLASGFQKPLGITVIPGTRIESFLSRIPVQKVWGIGPATTSYLAKFGITTALQFTQLKSNSVSLNKNHLEIQQELLGYQVCQLNPAAKNQYQSISKTRTFRPPSCHREILWAELQHNIEEAFAKARTYGYFVKKMFVFLKTQQFRYLGAEIKFDQKQQYPLLFRAKVRRAFQNIFNPKYEYRATGAVLTELSETTKEQISLFADAPVIEPQRARALYQVLQHNRKIDFGASLYLRHHHAKEQPSFKTALPRLNIPVLEI